MKISIVIPTYNEKLVLEDSIESLGTQSYENFEIIVVDDGSIDGTVGILENLSKSLPNFHFFEQKHNGPGVARNLGAKVAKGDILVFVDADMTFDKDFLSKLVKPIVSGKVKGTFSKEELVSNWDNIWARCWNINEGWEVKRRHPRNYPDHQPVFRAILKEEFDRVGGFTPGGYDDDWSLYKKLGYEAVNAPGAVFYHKNPSNLGEVFRQAKWVGKRKYKLGLVGDIVALVRTFFPLSLVAGMIKSVVNLNFDFLIFKVVYDFGAFVGVLGFLFSGKGAK